jgi:hypothetical protein
MCRISDCEQSTVSHTLRGKARKPHTCCECGRTIAVGETYARTESLYEGYWGTFKVCSHCEVAQALLSNNCGGWVFEQVKEEIEEHAYEYPTIADGLLQVADGMRRKWRWFGGGLMMIPFMPASIASVVKS